MKKTFFAVLVSTFFASLPAHAADDICLKDGKIRFRFGAKVVEEKASYCFDATRSMLESMNCHGRECAARKTAKRKIPMESLKGQFGSPGFKLCFEYKATPQIMEFYDGKKWWELDRCLFKEDNSFLDTSSLQGLMMRN